MRQSCKKRLLYGEKGSSMSTIMKAIHSQILATLGVGVCVVSRAIAAEGWETDFNKGLATAAAEGRTMLVEFTGSDWCPPCMHLRSKVLPTQEFKDFAEKNKLVLVELDFPRAQDKVTPEERKAREELSETYGIDGFPTMLVTDGKGTPYAKIVGGASNTASYINRLQKALDTKAAFEAKLAEADKLTGVDRAKALVAAIDTLPGDCRELHTDLIQEIIKNDPEDTTGYKKAADDKELLKKQLDEIKEITESSIPKDASGMEAMKKAFIASRAAMLDLLKRDDLLTKTKLIAYGYIAHTYIAEKDTTHALEYIDKAIALDPESDEAKSLRSIRKRIENLK